jgi:CheY-like chemotaxis protein
MLILVVDDDDLVRRVVAEFLDDLGFSVLEVTSASEALVLIRDRIELDLVITDVSMPEMDGMQLVEELKSMRPSLPVILMSGRPQKDHTQNFLAKPFNRKRLLSCIARATEPRGGAETHCIAPP